MTPTTSGASSANAYEPAAEMPSQETPERVYAKCQDCGLDLADRDAMNAHLSETLAPTGELGVTHRGHQAQVINPTDAERRASRVRLAVGDALNRLCEELWEDVERGRFTAAEVTANLWMFDLRDAWDEWVAESDGGD